MLSGSHPVSLPFLSKSRERVDLFQIHPEFTNNSLMALFQSGFCRRHLYGLGFVVLSMIGMLMLLQLFAMLDSIKCYDTH